MEKLKAKIINRLRSTEREDIDKLIAYMEAYDYFEAPASTKYHSNIKGGLALHSDLVVDLLLEKRERFGLEISEAECIIAGYLHDLCKMNMYEVGVKIAKDAETQSKWVGVESFVINEVLPIGHAEKSIAIASRYIKLTANEMLMIRWHMGLPTGPDALTYDRAIKFQPAVVAIFTADMEASHLLEKVSGIIERPVEVYNEYQRTSSVVNKMKENMPHDFKIDMPKTISSQKVGYDTSLAEAMKKAMQN